jgi:predicted site-specific integrase-resolvase
MAEVRENEYLLAAQVSRWAKEGKLPYVRTLGGHRRFPGAPIRELAERLASESMSIEDVLGQSPAAQG